MNQGWIKIHRKMIQWEWYDDIPVCRLFLHLLLTANHRDQKWRGVKIKRGQTLTSIANLSAGTGLTKKQIRCAIKKLKNTGEVASQGTNRYTIVTICNYNDYQPREGKQEDERGANRGQTEGKQRATNKNEKNVKNEKNGRKDIMRKKEFEEFWKEYPKKIGKKKAREKYLSLKRELHPTILEAVRRQKESRQWEEEQGKFIPHPATWLNQERWEDEVEVDPWKRRPGESLTEFEVRKYKMENE